MTLRLAATAFALSATAALAQPHPCQDDALARAGALLKLHWNDGDMMLADLPGEPDGSDRTAWWLDEAVTVLPQEPAPRGDEMLDVLQVTAAVYKANYILQFRYSVIDGYCALVGQSILEDVDL